MNLTYYGHACFGIELKGIKILLDPFISPNPLAEHIDVDRIEADYILISHGHEDHVADAERIAKRTGATIVSNFEIVSWFEKKGVKNGHPMNIGGSWRFDFGLLKYVNAVHSSVMPDGAYGGNPGGWLIEGDGHSIYYAGDTALTMDMKFIASHQPTLAILPLGDNFTMGVKDAVTCSEFIECDHIVGMHYDTFGYIKIDHELAVQEFHRAGKRLNLMEIGATQEYE